MTKQQAAKSAQPSHHERGETSNNAKPPTCSVSPVKAPYSAMSLAPHPSDPASCFVPVRYLKIALRAYLVIYYRSKQQNSKSRLARYLIQAAVAVEQDRQCLPRHAQNARARRYVEAVPLHNLAQEFTNVAGAMKGDFCVRHKLHS
jgi:hypothetical protein